MKEFYHMRTSFYNLKLTLSFLLLLLFFSCQNSVTFEDLKGEWKSVKAKRNGRETQTLDKVFFSFSQSDSITTNLFGQIETYPMKYDYPVIKLKSSNLEEINVLSLDGDTLSISMRIRQYRYDFELLKR